MGALLRATKQKLRNLSPGRSSRNRPGTLKIGSFTLWPYQKKRRRGNVVLPRYRVCSRNPKGRKSARRHASHQTSTQRERRRDGHPRRKLPISREDLITIRTVTDPDNVDGAILFCVILDWRYFMLRKSEYLGPGMSVAWPINYRCVIRAMGIETHCGPNESPGGPTSILFLYTSMGEVGWWGGG